MIKYLVSHLATFSMWPIGRGTGGQLGQPDYIQLKLTKTKEVQPCSQDLYRCGPTHIEQWISGERREFLILLFRKSLAEAIVRFIRTLYRLFHIDIEVSPTSAEAIVRLRALHWLIQIYVAVVPTSAEAIVRFTRTHWPLQIDVDCRSEPYL